MVTQLVKRNICDQTGTNQSKLKINNLQKIYKMKKTFIVLLACVALFMTTSISSCHNEGTEKKEPVEEEIRGQPSDTLEIEDEDDNWEE